MSQRSPDGCLNRANSVGCFFARTPNRDKNKVFSSFIFLLLITKPNTFGKKRDSSRTFVCVSTKEILTQLKYNIQSRWLQCNKALKALVAHLKHQVGFIEFYMIFCVSQKHRATDRYNIRARNIKRIINHVPSPSIKIDRHVRNACCLWFWF